jgi:lysozyme family protein
VGPVTLAAARRAEPRALVEALARARLDYYARLPGFPSFGAGWTRRVEEVRRQALLMAGG